MNDSPNDGLVAVTLVFPDSPEYPRPSPHPYPARLPAVPIKGHKIVKGGLRWRVTEVEIHLSGGVGETHVHLETDQ